MGFVMKDIEKDIEVLHNDSRQPEILLRNGAIAVAEIAYNECKKARFLYNYMIYLLLSLFSKQCFVCEKELL